MYLSAVPSGIIRYFEYLKVMRSKYLSVVLFEVSISGAFEYLLARYPLYRNICEINGQIPITDTCMLMRIINAER